MMNFVQKSVCIALISMLCVGSLNAQESRKSVTKVVPQQEQVSNLSTTANDCDPATNLDVVYTSDCKAELTWNAPAKGVLYNNGPYITDQGGGAGGLDASVINYPPDGLGSHGFNCNHALNYWIADDFVLTGDSFIENIEFYFYQTDYNNPNVSPIDGLWVRIYNDSPAADGTIIWEGSGNVLASTTWAGVYRVAYYAPTNTQRPIYSATATIDTSLEAGTYWLAYSATGTAASGPWANQCENPTSYFPGNALAFQSSGTWVPLVSTGGTYPYALPFVINGTGGILLPPCEPVTNVEGAYDPETKIVNLTWTSPDIAPEKYEIYLDNELIGESTTTEFTDEVAELEAGDYEYEYCVLPVYAEGVCEGDVAEVCAEVKFTVEVGIKTYINNFSIVPNPAHNNITITSKTNFHTVEIVSFLGQTVLSQSHNSNEVTLSVSNLTNGVYFVRIISKTGTSVQKFVKQ